MRAYTVNVLRDLGYRVLEAHDGVSALRLLERQESPIDLLFTDVVMPGMSGRELADEVRRLQPDLRVLYTSGYTRNAIVHGGRLDPGVELIAKPFNADALAQKIRDMLDRGQTGRVLLVASDAHVRALVGESLSGLGFIPMEAGTATEALATVRSATDRIDVVVFDEDAKAQNASAFVNEVRGLRQDLPVVLAVHEHSDLNEPDDCTAVIMKPYTGSILKDAFAHLKVRCGATKR